MYDRIADTDSEVVLHVLAPDGDRRSLATELASPVSAHRAPIDLAVSASTIAVLNYEVTEPQFDTRNNVRGTIDLCEASRRTGVRKIVYVASGGSRYGAPTRLPVGERTPVGLLSPYALAKLAGELHLGAYAGTYGLATICFAPANVYGPHQNPHGEVGVVAAFGSAPINGRPVTAYGDGTAARDYVYVNDVVDAFVRADAAPVSVSGTYNIGTGWRTTVTEVHRLTSAVLDESAPPRYGATRTGGLQAIAVDATRAAAVLGWRLAVDLVEGIQRTIQWLRTVLKPEPAWLKGA